MKISNHEFDIWSQYFPDTKEVNNYTTASGQLPITRYKTNIKYFGEGGVLC